MSTKSEEVTQLSNSLKKYSDKQLDTLRAEALELVSTNVDLNKICASLIAARQLYSLARFALNSLLTQAGYCWEDGIEEILIKSMNDRGDKPFTRVELMKLVTGAVSQFLLDEMDRETQLEKAEETKKQRLYSEIKASQTLTNFFGNKVVRAKSTILLVGTAYEISIAIEQAITNTANQKDFAVLSDESSNITSDDIVEADLDRLRYCYLTTPTTIGNQQNGTQKISDTVVVRSHVDWRYIATKRETMEELFPNMIMVDDRPCDVFIVDHASRLCKPTLVGTSTDEITNCVTENVRTPIKTIRRLTREANMIFVAGIVTDGSKGALEAVIKEYKDVPDVIVVAL